MVLFPGRSILRFQTPPTYHTPTPACPFRQPDRTPIDSHRNRGFTLIELLVGMAIVGILFAIIVPAVMSSREASRRGQCLSHLRQMGLAIHAFQSAQENFPEGSDEDGYSLHVSILPHLDEAPLYEQIKAETGGPETTAARSIVNPVFLCPSDGYGDLQDEHGSAATNYAGNFGTGVQRDGYNGMFRHANGWADYQKGPLRPGDVADGLSNTAMLSETLIGNGAGGRLRTIWRTERRLAGANQLGKFALICKRSTAKRFRSGRSNADPWSRGRPWTKGDAAATLYNHVLTPNQLSCYNKDLVQEGIYTAGSAHQGGVNLLFGDGRAKFTAENISPDVWTELGSRRQ